MANEETKKIHPLGFLTSDFQPSGTPQAFLEMLDLNAGKLTDYVTRHLQARADINSNNNFSPQGKIAEMQRVQKAALDGVEGVVPTEIPALKQEMAQARQAIPPVPPPPQQLADVMNAQEVRRRLLSMEDVDRRASIESLVRSANAAAFSACLNDPMGELVPASARAGLIDKYQGAAAPDVFARIARIEHVARAHASNVASAKKIIQEGGLR